MSVDESPVLQQSSEGDSSRLKVEKVTVNIAVGSSGENLERAVQVLGNLTGQKPVRKEAKRSVRDFGIRKGEPIACAVTLRKARAVSFLRRALDAVGGKISASNFDEHGNFSFGIKEHIDIPGTRYVPELGIFGMDVCVVLEKPGGRVKRRHYRPSTIGHAQRVSREEAQLFMTGNFGIAIL